MSSSSAENPESFSLSPLPTLKLSKSIPSTSTLSSSQSISHNLKEKFPNLSVSLVTSGSSVLPLPPVNLPPSQQSLATATPTATLVEMFPLLSETDILSALAQCNGQMSSALDLLLARDFLDSEMHHHSLYSGSRPICDLWVGGQCSGARAAACRDRHFYNDTDSREGLAQGGKMVERQLKVFSSPYRAKVIMEQVKVHKEQVNLGTGKEENWTEVQERELIDLTGDVMEEVIELSSEDEERINHERIIAQTKEIDFGKKSKHAIEDDEPKDNDIIDINNETELKRKNISGNKKIKVDNDKFKGVELREESNNCKGVIGKSKGTEVVKKRKHSSKVKKAKDKKEMINKSKVVELEERRNSTKRRKLCEDEEPKDTKETIDKAKGVDVRKRSKRTKRKKHGKVLRKGLEGKLKTSMKSGKKRKRLEGKVKERKSLEGKVKSTAKSGNERKRLEGKVKTEKM